jgi:parvulin-like peptidyl-prolyl isomerase
MKRLGAAALGLTSLVALSALAAPQAQPLTDAERRATAVASYTGGAVTVGEIEDTIADSSPLVQATALEPDSLREFLDRNLRFELELQEAERRGYREDARVRKAAKENAVQLMISRDINASLRADPVSPEVLRTYFDTHRDAFSLAELRRVSGLFVATEAEARSLLPQFKTADDEALRQLVQARGLDVPSKIRGGDIGRFNAAGKPESGEEPIDPKIVKAAFALDAIGAVSDVIRLDDGRFVILKYTEHRDGYVPQFEEVKVRVSRRYDDERYEKAVQTIVEAQRAILKPVVHAELVDSVRLD